MAAVDPLFGYETIPNFVKMEDTARLVVTEDSEKASDDKACARACWSGTQAAGKCS